MDVFPMPEIASFSVSSTPSCRARRAPLQTISLSEEEGKKVDCKMKYSDDVVWPEVPRELFLLPSLRCLSSLFKLWRCSLTSKLRSSLLPPGDTLSISSESVYLNEKRYNPQSGSRGSVGECFSPYNFRSMYIGYKIGFFHIRFLMPWN